MEKGASGARSFGGYYYHQIWKKQYTMTMNIQNSHSPRSVSEVIVSIILAPNESATWSRIELSRVDSSEANIEMAGRPNNPRGKSFGGKTRSKIKTTNAKREAARLADADADETTDTRETMTMTMMTSDVVLLPLFVNHHHDDNVLVITSINPSLPRWWERHCHPPVSIIWRSCLFHIIVTG